MGDYIFLLNAGLKVKLALEYIVERSSSVAEKDKSPYLSPS
jgi:hypothetical protein